MTTKVDMRGELDLERAINWMQDLQGPQDPRLEPDQSKVQTVIDAARSYLELSQRGLLQGGEAISALRFYSDRSNYHDRLVQEPCGCCSTHESAPIERDDNWGDRARTVLNALDKGVKDGS